MILWSYKLERFDPMAQPDGHAAAETALNARGAEGWELVGIHHVDSLPFAIYKRPVDIGEADE